MNKRYKFSKKGFTLVELLIVMGIVGVLATGIIVAINPGARFAQVRDMKRKENLERIYSAIQNKLLSEEGAWENCEEIPFEPTFIGKGEGNYDLYSCLVPKYLSKELYDPKDGNSENSGYEIWRTGLGKIGLRAKREKPPGYIIVGALPTLPIVTTIEPTNITDTSAETGGKVHYQGDSEVTERGVVWDIMPRPTIEDHKITAGSGLGEFEVTLSSLEPETTYYVRAYAINESGIAYGPEYSFQTQTPTYPRVKTLDASDVKVHSANLNGEILSLGQYSSVYAYFEYRKKGESGWPLKSSKILTGQTGSFSQVISALDEETTYEFRFVAEYSDGKTEGDVLEFTTLSTDPVVRTLPAEDITWNSSKLKGELVSLGIYSEVEVYFLYRKTGEIGWLMTDSITKNSPGTFSINLSHLNPETEYEFKAIVKYETKKREGEVLKFSTTSTPPPSVETTEATFNIQPGTLEVTLKGNLIDLGGYTTVQGYFRYRKKGETDWNETPKTELTQTGYFSQALFNLQLNTSYEFEALVDYGENTAFGGVSEFTTPTGDVEIETKTPDVLGREATLKGELVSLGVYTQALVYFKYRESGTSIWYQTQKARITTPGIFSAKIENLNSNTTYQFLALADYDGKTAQGYIMEFTTQKAPVQISTKNATNITVESATLRGRIEDLGDYSEAYVYFKYKKSGESSWKETQKIRKTTLGDFSEYISNLEINTEYKFKALADFDGRTAEGELKSFSTPREGVKVKTEQATDIESDSVILHGRITYLYGYPSTDVFFQYKKKNEENWHETPSQTLYGEESFTYPLSNLKENTQYEFRAVAKYGNNKKVYGEILNFTTLEKIKIETLAASSITQSEATLNGKLTSLGSFNKADVYFQYKKKSEASWSSTQKILKNAPGSFSSHITNLSSDTQYEFRAVAEYTNENTGKNYISYGNILNFSTPKTPVAVKTLSLDKNDYTGDTAKLKGKITSLGDYPSAKVFFRYKQPNTPWYQTQKTQITSPASFYAQISGLSPNTQTQYQALAEFDGKISQGEILTFTTDPPEFRVETKPATNIKSTSATLNGRVTSLGIYHQGKVYFKYKKSGDTTWKTTSKITLSQKQEFSINVSNLSPTTYVFKAIGEANGHIWEGSTLSFKVLGIDNTKYMRPVTINNKNNSNNLSQYQVLITLNTAQLISQGKMKSNCADIRITDTDQSTKLKYWIQSGCNTSSTKIWVRVPSIPKQSTKTIYLFYGNPNLSSESNGSAVFDSYSETKQSCCYSSGCSVTLSFPGGQKRLAPYGNFYLTTWGEGDLNSSSEYVDIYHDGHYYTRACKSGCSQCGGCWQTFYSNANVTSYAKDGLFKIKGDASSSVNDFCRWLCYNHALALKSKLTGYSRKYIPPEPTVSVGAENP